MWGKKVRALANLFKPLRGRIVPPIAVVAEFPGMDFTEEEIQLQRRPHLLFRNRFVLSAGPRGSKPPKSLPLEVGGRERLKARCAVVSFLQSLLSPNFLEWILQRKKFVSKGDRIRFSGIDSSSPLVRVGPHPPP
ncbi:hypothetical protein AK95_21905 [Paenibacillus sp. LC231]|uniref:hypothetical protein n=1 Tax=Paenibacillus sp. LC231 TaxID=1120679 RepID=UPI0008DDD7CE|nr:hypothetical protein [Paenibacillus sp. LC231]OIA99824.1 hypothetical protein AK95_21905 [Paenibacillus sp. LC231]